jgi:hypothetical protein
MENHMDGPNGSSQHSDRSDVNISHNNHTSSSGESLFPWVDFDATLDLAVANAHRPNTLSRGRNTLEVRLLLSDCARDAIERLSQETAARFTAPTEWGVDIEMLCAGAIIHPPVRTLILPLNRVNAVRFRVLPLESELRIRVQARLMVTNRFASLAQNFRVLDQ